MANIKRLSPAHELILEWILLHPDRNLGECAQVFGYTQGWLSQIVHSDMFQAQLRSRMDAIGEDCLQTVTAKLKGIAGLVVDRTLEKLQNKPSDRFIIDSGRMALTALGYLSNQEPQRHEHLHLHANVDADLVLQARQRLIQQAMQNPPIQKIIDATSAPFDTGSGSGQLAGTGG